MQHVLKVRFDKTSDEKLRRVWGEASEHFGTNYLHETGVIPHMALLVGDEVLADVFNAILIPEFKIELSGLGFFSDGNIAFIHCRLDSEIFELHGKLYEFAKSRGAIIDELYSPENWVPHCKIAVHCTMNHQSKIAFEPIFGQSFGLTHVKYPPPVLLADKPIVSVIDDR